jgi:hypothetical protein
VTDQTPADISSAAAIQAPLRHPTLDVEAKPGGHSTGLPREPDAFMAGLLEGFEEDTLLEDSHGQEVLRLDRSRWLEFAQAAKEAGFEVCADITAVDWYPTPTGPVRVGRQPALPAASSAVCGS